MSIVGWVLMQFLEEVFMVSSRLCGVLFVILFASTLSCAVGEVGGQEVDLKRNWAVHALREVRASLIVGLGLMATSASGRLALAYVDKLGVQIIADIHGDGFENDRSELPPSLLAGGAFVASVAGTSYALYRWVWPDIKEFLSDCRILSGHVWKKTCGCCSSGGVVSEG